MNLKYAGYLFIILVIIALIGFGLSGEKEIADNYSKRVDETSERNKKSIDNEKIVGITKDGQEVKLIVLEYLDYDCYGCNDIPSIKNHYVYSVGKVTTNNIEVKNGKHTEIEPHVVISE